MAHPHLVSTPGPGWALRALRAWLGRVTPRHDHRTLTVALALPDGHAWSRRVGAGGATVRCALGSALLTREGDREDRVLVAGESFRSERPGRLALLALGSADLVIHGDLRRADRRPARGRRRG